jgi:predicted mannosyl-3-phosphoglycerate phosphatase (HAD superfamily)
MFEHFSNRKRIAALEEAFEKLARDFNALKLEWADALEKITRMAGRVAKRAALAQEKEDLLMGVQPTGEPPSASLPFRLTPRQRLIQEQIAARRRESKDGEQ